MESSTEMQNEEMESLQSIYMDEFVLLNESPLTYELIVLADTEDSTLEDGIKARLRVEYTEKYPEEAPLISAYIGHPLSKTDLNNIEGIIEKARAEFSGMAIVFDVGESVREYLQERKAKLTKEEQKIKDDVKQEKSYKIIKLDKEITSFTPVTVDTYTIWREKFDKEKIEEQKTKLGAAERKQASLAEEAAKRPTGREYFEIKKQQMQQKEGQNAKGEVFFYDEEAFDDIGDVDDVDLS
eukprot:TRINITY_DN7864_c0_g1_i2.p1 TRINITY_DN7864_c0_g1~~TRINITY_DN7864_c0_g1_i2.p1  ORF type:complete len:240 (-),score=96.68 TRINITY_DN7864_c0_g1_i2:152-871(-)